MTRALHVRLTEAEHAALARLAVERRLTVSRLVRRAVREMATGAPDLFDDGQEVLSRLYVRLAAVERALRAGDHGPDPDVAAEIAMVREAVAALVRASRRRWAGALKS